MRAQSLLPDFPPRQFEIVDEDLDGNFADRLRRCAVAECPAAKRLRVATQVDLAQVHSAALVAYE